MKPGLLFSFILALMSGLSYAQDRTPTWFVFLVTGDNPPTAAQDEIRAYQSAHIKNFKRLFNEGKLVTAGPLQDKTGEKRGIVVFCVESKEAVIAGFRPDPYVQKGFMKVEAYPLRTLFGKLNTSGIDPDGIEEHRIAVIELAPSAEDKAERNLDTELLEATSEKSGLGYFGRIDGSDTIHSVALFRGSDDTAITGWLDELPPIKAGLLKYAIMPQWFSKGVL